MHSLKHVAISLVVCLGTASTLSAKKVNIPLMQEDPTQSYEYALGTHDESDIPDIKALKFHDVKKKGVKLSYNDDRPYHLYIRTTGKTQKTTAFPLKGIPAKLDNQEFDYLVIRQDGATGYGYKNVSMKQPKTRS